MDFKKISVQFLYLIQISVCAFSSTIKGKPNVLWIFIEDASCHISCYGETAIQTPNIDVLAAEGVRFETPLSHLPNIEESRPYTGEN